MAKKIKFKVVAKPKSFSKSSGGILNKKVVASINKINNETKSNT